MSASDLLNKVLNSQVAPEGEDLNTDYLLCPELDSVFGTIKKWDFRSGTWTEESTQKERIWANVSFHWEIDSEEARAAIKRDKVMVNQTIMLTITDEGTLDKDNNQTLGRLGNLFGIKAKDYPSLKEYLDAFQFQSGYVKIKHRGLTQKDKTPLLDEEGNQKMVSEVVAVSLTSSAD